MRISDWSLDVCSSDLWVGPQSWCRHLLQQYRIDRINRRWGDGVAEADVDLGFATCPGQIGRNDYTNAAVTSFLADLLDYDGGSVEHDTVVDWYGCDVPEYLGHRSEEHTSELQSLMRISYAVFCLTKKT